jgi:lipopolysaccharide transport system ATP-binding protein
MNRIAIRVTGLSKQFRIGQVEYYRTLRDTLAHAAALPWRIARLLLHPNGRTRSEPRTIWALQDVSFEIPRGEVVGVIGANGAGKSTLLRILSRITEPTTGEAAIHGRVGSLLEVGTGFHPELSGRENIYLNGAILGMKRAEIQRRFDEMVAFAEVEKFVDTPVKHYSSGMYLRLAFSVAAHLDPEILLVDEVLAVGDMAFQSKCLGRMGQVAGQGRTVLLVSHQLNQIRRLCKQCAWLDGGRLAQLGPTADVISAYEARMNAGRAVGDAARAEDRLRTGFVDWRIREPQSENPHALSSVGSVSVEFTLQVAQPVRHGNHGIALFSAENQLMWANSYNGLRLEPGVRRLVHTLPSLPLRPGNYSWQVSLYDEGARLDLWEASPYLTVATDPVTHPQDRWQGILNLPSVFQAE